MSENPVNEQLKQIVEAALFAADKPLSIAQLKNLFEETAAPKTSDINLALQQLSEDYQDRGVHLVEVATGYRFQTAANLSTWVQRLWEEKPPRFSRAVLETLALMAYRQPITRGEIEEIRGVSVSSQIVRTLLERGWIRVVGHKEVPGRPALYATTDEFLAYFNLASLEDLPPLADLQSIALEEQQQADNAPIKVPETLAAQQSAAVEFDDVDDAIEDDQSAMPILAMDEVDSVLDSFDKRFKQGNAFASPAEDNEEARNESSPLESEINE